ncbi:hypothetical protein [Brevundimonas sp. R86498]|uniref:hypothetical protein n=1 Tax=Brevundimonas sp. R86498 TaxID=3093845 RepID=UPI0037C5A708
MKVGPYSGAAASTWAAILSQTTSRVAAHQSSPTDRPVEPLTTVKGGAQLNGPSRQTFDIRV